MVFRARIWWWGLFFFLTACGNRMVTQSVQIPLVVTDTAVPTATVAPVTLTPTPTVTVAIVTPTLVPPAITPTYSADVLDLRPEVVAVYDHDPAAFTQGLLWTGDHFYESTGLYGESSLRQIDLEGRVIQLKGVDADFFGEGLALVDDRLIQLTWRENVALVYDVKSFEEIGRFYYAGEGWGLCYAADVGTLWMSDGSHWLVERDASSFEEIGRVEVRRQGEPVTRLNELECVGDKIYANVWQSDLIMEIERENGRVSAVVDASQLLTAEERANFSSNDVLNGIAYDPERELFYLTGKRWPKLFAVRLVDIFD